jgi:HEAT repeats
MSASTAESAAAIAQIDRAIVAFIERSSDDTAEALRLTGEPGLRRMLDLWFGDGKLSVPSPTGSGRDLVDRWTDCLGLLAATLPDVFVTGLAGRALGTAEISMLGGCRCAGATRLLCEHARDSDWLVRYNAVRSLVRASDPAGRECIEAALSDPNLVVRSVAIKGVSRWDPERALGLYSAFLDVADLTPLLRTQAKRAIVQLRTGADVRDPLDPI